MGEFALYEGENIKIGTCEDMYYLRADQAHMVTALPGNVDPIKNRDQIRFRFPFPSEDRIKPGQFDDPFKGFKLWGFRATGEGFDHGTTQFRHDNGYLVSLPCPENGDEDRPYKIHRNGYGGSTEIIQQRYWEGRLVTVIKCRGCGEIWRLPTLEDVQPALDEITRRADEESRTARLNNTPGNEEIAKSYREIVARIRAGYELA